MKLRLALLTSALLVSSAAFARAQEGDGFDKVAEREPGRTVYNYPYDDVWAATMDALASWNVAPQAAQKENGTIFFQTDATWSAQWGGVNNMVERMTTKQVSRWSTWQGIATKGNLYCKKLDEYKTEVKATFQFSGFNRWSGSWEPLYSSGWLEERIFEIITIKLPARPTLIERPGAPGVVTAAEALLLTMRKVDAAYKLEAGDAVLLAALIDAQAKFDDFSGSPHAKAVPKIAARCDAAIGWFKLARDAESRDAHLASARDALRAAADYLAGYRKHAAEISLTPAPAAELVKP